MKKLLCVLASISGIVAILMLLAAGPLYHLDIVHFSVSFAVMKWAAYVGIASIVLVILTFIFARPSAPGHRALLALSIVLGFIAFYLPYSQMQTAQSVPRIHDITTDTNNPPEFIAIAPLRADASNPVEYAGEETAVQQREAYPDVVTQIFNQPYDQVFAAALQVAQDSGWELVDSNLEQGRIEATATTTWFGFKDDVVIRVTQGNDEILVDVRSKSRVGLSDVGANAARIRAYQDRLEALL